MHDLTQVCVHNHDSAGDSDSIIGSGVDCLLTVFGTALNPLFISGMNYL